MTMQVSAKSANDGLSGLVRSAERGEITVITRNGKPVADIVPHVTRTGGVDFAALERWKTDRGIERAVIYVAPDFDDPLPEPFWLGKDT